MSVSAVVPSPPTPVHPIAPDAPNVTPPAAGPSQDAIAKVVQYNHAQFQASLVDTYVQNAYAEKDQVPTATASTLYEGSAYHDAQAAIAKQVGLAASGIGINVTAAA
jgi:hypothetical protein